RPPADRDASVERAGEFAERRDVAVDAVSDSRADGRQHARRQRRLERGANADGACCARHLRVAGRSAHDGLVRQRRVRHHPLRREDGLRPAHEPGVPAAAESDDRIMNRVEATRVIVQLAGDAPIIASLGHPAYDLYAAGDRPGNFYTWGSMGLASSIGLGLALARPDVRGIVLDGDGSLLMNLGSLATIWLLHPANLVILLMITPLPT